VPMRVFHAPSRRLRDARLANEGARKCASFICGKYYRDSTRVCPTGCGKISPSQRVSTNQFPDTVHPLMVSSIAYMALPIILNSLDLQSLSPTNARTEGKRRQLRLLNEAMDLCNDRYTGALAANNIIKRIIEAACSEQDSAKIQASISTSLVRSAPDIQDWFEVFVRKPTQYLRISFTIDMSLSTGRYPDTEDLPQRLSTNTCLIPNHSIPKSLMPVVEELPTSADVIDETAMLEPTRNSHLDYFDFNEPQTWARSDSSPWNGQTVYKILDEVLGGGERLWAGANA
jgi:hypothetical protein